MSERFGEIAEVRMSPSARHVAWRYTDASDPSYPWMSGPISPGATLMWLSDDGVADWTRLAPSQDGPAAYGDVYVHLRDEMPLVEETLSLGKLSTGPMVNVDMTTGGIPVGVEVIGALSVTIEGKRVTQSEVSSG